MTDSRQAVRVVTGNYPAGQSKFWVMPPNLSTSPNADSLLPALIAVLKDEELRNQLISKKVENLRSIIRGDGLRQKL